ncbi:uncharacterized protein LOC119982192 isoform X1 [Tripterygium wilfordii]|uniref:uncharacterized protein LOC119982192 isoform X1 n=1 Tax=Tripterygium wilfordii TaxID=458696 RepID=UPI0018F7F359|nr:uncharacterized protein LOC119982192 isoform X1 [Tripterygium wilfordii]
MFLEMLRVDGNSYALQIPLSGEMLLVMKYEEEVGFSNGHRLQNLDALQHLLGGGNMKDDKNLWDSSKRDRVDESCQAFFNIVEHCEGYIRNGTGCSHYHPIRTRQVVGNTLVGGVHEKPTRIKRIMEDFGAVQKEPTVGIKHQSDRFMNKGGVVELIFSVTDMVNIIETLSCHWSSQIPTVDYPTAGRAGKLENLFNFSGVAVEARPMGLRNESLPGNEDRERNVEKWICFWQC